jgi:hypothetical protein
VGWAGGCLCPLPLAGGAVRLTVARAVHHPLDYICIHYLCACANVVGVPPRTAVAAARQTKAGGRRTARRHVRSRMPVRRPLSPRSTLYALRLRHTCLTRST